MPITEVPNPISNSHDFCLRVLCELRQLNSEDRICEALQELQPRLEELREYYRSHDQINIEYEEDVCDAYLLGYVPYYIQQANKLFENYLASRSFGDSITVVFLASGPGPEAVAFTDFLIRHFPETRAKFLFFDLRDRHWAPLRKKMVELGCEGRSENIVTESHFLDLLNPHSLEQHADVFKKTDVVVAQNCINELIESQDTLLANFQKIISLLRDDSVFCLSDLRAYSLVRNFLSDLRDKSDEHAEVSSPNNATYDGLGPPRGHILRRCFYGPFGSPRVPRRRVKCQENFLVTRGHIQDLQDIPFVPITELAFRELREEVLNGEEYAVRNLESHGYLQIDSSKRLREHVHTARSICVALWLSMFGNSTLEKDEKSVLEKEVKHAISLVDRVEPNITYDCYESPCIEVKIQWPKASFVNAARIEISIRNSFTNQEISIEDTVIERSLEDTRLFRFSEFRNSQEIAVVKIRLGTKSFTTESFFPAREVVQYEFDLPVNERPLPEPVVEIEVEEPVVEIEVEEPVVEIEVEEPVVEIEVEEPVVEIEVEEPVVEIEVEEPVVEIEVEEPVVEIEVEEPVVKKGILGRIRSIFNSFRKRN